MSSGYYQQPQISPTEVPGGVFWEACAASWRSRYEHSFPGGAPCKVRSLGNRGSTASNATIGTAPTSVSMPRLSIGLKLFSPYSRRVFLPAPREGDEQSSKNL